MYFTRSLLAVATASLAFLPSTTAIRMIQSTSLNTCQEVSNFTASLFDVVFTPDNASFAFNVNAVSTITGNVTFSVIVQAYGYTFIQQTLDPCSLGLEGLCPMSAGSITILSNFPVSESVVNEIPAIAYGVPDLDAVVTVHINSTADPLVSQACLQASLSNGQTVNQKGVSWTTAAIAGIGLVASAIVSGLGHSNTAAHIASYALSLFGYFQAVAIVGMLSTPMPPVVQSWTQNFQWSMGIISVNFMQNIASWYQTATGGTPATVLNTLTTTSVQVVKRATPEIVSKSARLAGRALAAAPTYIAKRTNYQNTINTITGTYVVRGINRVAFLADMEATNVFLTGLAFFCIFVTFTIIGVCVFKALCELAVRARWMKSERFLEFRNGWQVVLKGIMFRMVLIGFPQMTVLCFWEFTQVDSPAEVVLAVFFLLGMAATLGWATHKVFSIAKRSEQMHKNPAYILYSDPAALHKWGFLYVQFRATAYYYILPLLIYAVVKAMFTSLGQPSGAVQAIAFVIIEAVALIAASVLRPWMDKSTNIVGIAICAMNFLNAIFVLVFSNIFNQPALATGIMGVLFWVINAIFALILLIFVFVMSLVSLFRKNPDARYQPMSDDRASFMKSQTALTTELDALGATARGDGKPGFKHGLDLDEDDTESWSSDSLRQKEAAGMPLPPSTANSNAHYREPPRSPINPNTPFLAQSSTQNNSARRSPYENPFAAESRPKSDLPLLGNGGRSQGQSPAGYPRAGSSQSNVSSTFRAQNNASPIRGQNNASPWQRGAGYDH